MFPDRGRDEREGDNGNKAWTFSPLGSAVPSGIHSDDGGEATLSKFFENVKEEADEDVGKKRCY